MFRIEHNAETGEILTIELTAKEILELEKEDKVRKAKEAEAQIAQSAIAASKAALYEKLGITAEEAKLLLG
jgi:uncharacterized 2Fe-2S/4Fe-4S cluster protein (DUF4445 family)